MQKKIISIILAFTLVLLSVVPCFADDISTPSAIKYNDNYSVKSTSDVKANGDTVAPVSSSGTVNYYNGTSSNGAYSSTISTWGNLVTYLSDSFARSIRALATVISTASNNEITSIDNVWSRLGTILGSVDQIEGYIDGIEGSLVTVYTYLGNIKNYVDDIENKIDTSNYNTSNIYNVLSNGLDIDLGAPWQPYFMPADDYNFNSQDWKYWYLPVLDNDTGWTQSSDINNTNYLYGVKNALSRIARSVVVTGYRTVTGVRNGSQAMTLYNTDLTSFNTGTGSGSQSIWYDLRALGSNVSLHLSRLGYVLASDEEIEARQAAASNQDSVVDNFIKPTGSGSASASDFADVASAGSSIKDALNSNVSAGNAFTSLDSNSDAWNWFSQSTLNSLDSSSSQNRKSANSDTPLLDSYYSDLMETLRLK